MVGTVRGGGTGNGEMGAGVVGVAGVSVVEAAGVSVVEAGGGVVGPTP
jgi:hypothetical protein